MGTRNKKNYKKRHPDSSYDAKYPYNQVMVTEAGHEFHWDNTPGNERIREAHMSGTYYEISPDGKRVTQIVGDEIKYVKGGRTTTVDKNVDTKHGGSVRTSSHGDHHTEVKGNQTTAIDKDQSTTVGGDVNKACKGDMSIGVTGKTTMKIGDGIKIKGDSKIDSKIDAEAEFQFGKTLRIYSKQPMKLHCDSHIQIVSPRTITLIVGGSSIKMTPEAIHIKAQTVKIGGGAEVHVKSGVNKVDPPWISGAQEPEGPDT